MSEDVPVISRQGCTIRLGKTLSLVFLCLLGACDTNVPTQINPEAAKGAEKPAVSKPSYNSELAALNASIEAAKQLSAKQTGDTLLRLEWVSLHLERAWLTGNFEDYAQAESLLSAVESRVGYSSPACLARAKLHYTLHRVQLARETLAYCPSTTDNTEIAALRGDIAFYSGRYHEAEQIYRSLVNGAGLPTHYTRLALLKDKLGSPGEAAAFLEAAEKRYHGVSATTKAWLKLQRGLIALGRGRFDEALAMYRLASDELPGWWLIDEHIAEVKNLSGDRQGARLLYGAVIQKTGAPQFMDALASIELEEGKAQEARTWWLRARVIYDERLKQFPEAAAGHALTHFLRDAGSPQRALELALANFKTRPYGDAALALARAHLLNGQPGLASTLIETQLASGWDTAESYWVQAEIHRALGQPAKAEQAKKAALSRNPGSARMYALDTLKL